MTNWASKRERKPSRKNVTAQWRAIANPKCERLVKKLRGGWKELNKVERGDCLIVLVRLGCSKRGLAEAIGVSQTTVRRHVEIASLPDSDRKAVTLGQSAKKILEKRATQKRKQRTAKRLQQERDTGRLSDEVADAIITFCSSKDDATRPQILPDQVGLFLSQAAVYLSNWSRFGVARVRTSKRLGIEELIKRTQPAKDPDVEEIGQQAEWLAAIIREIAPEQEIWEMGLRKAERRTPELHKLKDKKSPSQLYKERVQRLAAISNPFQSRRRF